MQNQNTAVALKVNEKNLVRNLKYAFSNKATVLGELMQNARRAKASKIEFTMEGNVLTVVDDGIGITNMQNLLTIGESGWDAETLAEEKAFGMGWLSCLFAAQHVTVESRGKLLKFDVNDAIDFRQIEVKDAPAKSVSGTRLVLAGFEMNEHAVKAALSEKAKGFPITVSFNGEELERPYTLTSRDDAFTAVGHVSIRGLHFGHEDEELFTSRHMIMFLQGLPINGSSSMCTRYDIIVHLDSKRFAGRMPDRDKLVDEKEVIDEVDSVVKTLIREHLQAQRKLMSGAAWLNMYWDALKYADCLNLAASEPFLPARICKFITEPLTRITNWDNNGLAILDVEKHFDTKDALVTADFMEGCITREAVEQGRLKLVELPSVGEDSSYAVAYQVAHANRAIVLNSSSLPAGHWAQQHILSLDPFDYPEEVKAKYVMLPISEVARGGYSLEFGCESGDVVVAEKFHLGFEVGGKAVMLGAADSSFALSMADNEASSNAITFCVMYDPVHKCLPDAGALPHQVEDFQDEWGVHMEDDADDEASRFARYAQSLISVSPVDTLLSLVQAKLRWDIREIEQLHGKTFTLAVDEKGEVTIGMKQGKKAQKA